MSRNPLQCPACHGTLPKHRPIKCPHCICFLRFNQIYFTDETITKLDKLVRTHPYAPEAYELVFNACKGAIGRANGVRGFRSAGPTEICTEFRRQAFFVHRANAAERCREMGIQTSTDIGKIMTLLVDAVLFRYSSPEEADPRRFDGIYEVGDGSWSAFWQSDYEQRGQCGDCGYDLRGSPSMVCPECGKIH